MRKKQKVRKRKRYGFEPNLARVFLVSVTILMAVFLPVQRALGQNQAASGTIQGMVTDASGAVVPDASVTVTSTEQGFNRQASTNQQGEYVFTLLPAGHYSLKVEKQGLSTYTHTDFGLEVGQTVDVPVSLTMASVNQQVQVTGAVPQLDTSDANVSTEISEKAIRELPLNQRNVFGLVFLNSAVTNTALTQWTGGTSSNQPNADQDISFLNFGGSRFGDTEFLLDGHWDIDGQWGGIIYVPGVDETQEFRLQSNSFSAQYGFSSGNVVNVITKSGTNDYHGDVFEFLRNDDLDANNFFANGAGIPRKHFERNQFGATFGGPVYIPHLYHGHNKTFFFVDYEGLRASSPVTATQTVPTAAERAGDFSSLLGAQIGTDALGRPILAGAVYNPYSTRAITAGQIDSETGLRATSTGYIRDPYPGNMIPQGQWDKLATKLLTYWPSPTNSASFNNFVESASSPQKQDAFTVRIDQNIDDKSRLFVRFSKKNEFKTGDVALYGAADPGGPGVLNGDNRWDFGLGYTRTLSDTLVMSANLGWNRWIETNVAQGNPFDVSALGWPGSLNVGGGVFPSVNVSGYAGLGSGAPQVAPREARTVSLDFNKVHGKHLFTFGFDLYDQYYNNLSPGNATLNFGSTLTAGPDPFNPTANTGFALASFLVGAGSGNFNQTGSQTSNKKYYAWYFQDDWKLTPKLTLNLGLRYEFQTSPTDRFNTLSWFDPTATNPISAQSGAPAPGELVFTGGSNGRDVIEPNYVNFAPRIGIAYHPWSKLVVRAAYGIFYPAQISLAVDGNLNGFSQSTPWVSTASNGVNIIEPATDAFQTGLLPLQGNSLGGLTNVGQNVNAIQHNWRSPYVQDWTIGIQYALTNSDTVEAQYVGNHGIRLPVSGGININQIPDSNLALGVAALTAPVANPYYPLITSSSCGLDQPTVEYGQLLRPFPEFCNVNSQQVPIGSDTYNALMLTWNHRFSHGLQLLASYTRSKWLDDTTGNAAWSWGASNNQFRDNNNIALDKSVDASDTPNSFVVSLVYELPVGRGRAVGAGMNRVLDTFVGGWQVAGIGTFRSGVPLDITSNQNTTYSFGGNQNPNIIANPVLAHPTVNEWFNTAAFTYASPLTFGDSPRNNAQLRGPGTNNWDLSVQKYFTLSERFKLQFRSEFFNAFNHPRFVNPDTGLGDPAFGTIQGSFAPRDVQLALKLYW
jgi:Carboxypeptidase regulatory-like domain/TonB dependent receptor